MVWNGEVERVELQPGCKCCCQCRQTVSPHGYWTEYTLRTSPLELTYGSDATYPRTWSAPITLRRVPNIVDTFVYKTDGFPEYVANCTPCVWISDDEKWAFGGDIGLAYATSDFGADNKFIPRVDGQCGYQSVYRSVFNGYAYDDGRYDCFPFGPIAGVYPPFPAVFLYGGPQLGTSLPLANPIQLHVGATHETYTAVEIQPSGRFICCSKACPNSPSVDLELTITGCGTPVVVALIRQEATNRYPLYWKSADGRYTFQASTDYDFALQDIVFYINGFVLFTAPYLIENSTAYPRPTYSKWVSCDPGTEFLVAHQGEYVCPDNIHRIVTMEIRQAGGGVMPGYGYGDCFPYGNSPPPPPPPPAVP